MVETGTNLGCSTIVLAQALADCGFPGKVYSVETDEASYLAARRNVARSGTADRVELFHMDSLDFLAEPPIDEPVFTAVFLDGAHSEEYAYREFSLVHPRLDHKSIVLLDNTYRIAEQGEDQRVNGALRRIVEDYGGNLVNFENVSWFTPGQAIWQMDPFRDDWS